MKVNREGFTLLEVLIAVTLFGLAITAIVTGQSNSYKSVTKSERMSEALQLLQSQMTELEMKYQKALDTNGLAAAVAKEEGTFSPPYENYKWSAELKEVEMEITVETVVKMLTDFGMEPDEALNQAESKKLVLVNLNKAIKENYAELRVRVDWTEFGNKMSVPLVTHLIPTKPKIQLKMSAE